MRTLIQAGPIPRPQANHRPRRRAFPEQLLKGSLIAADVFLVVQATLLMNRAATPVSWFEIGLCFLALALGAWLSCLAVWRNADHPQAMSRRPDVLLQPGSQPPP